MGRPLVTDMANIYERWCRERAENDRGGRGWVRLFAVSPKFALDEAARRGAHLRVVWAFFPAEYWATEYGMPIPRPFDEVTEDLERAGKQMVDEVVRASDGAGADVPVTVQALLGSPGEVLVEQAQNTDLLILGHRGRGRFRSGVLGSVGLHCVLHASVPVTIVRPMAHSTPVAHTPGSSARH